MSNLLANFQHSDSVEPHVLRTREMIKKYPEIAQLMGRNPNTFWFILLVVGLQIGIAYFAASQAWWVVLLLAYWYAQLGFQKKNCQQMGGHFL